MASRAQRSSQLELRGPEVEIPLPKPLRIVKRGQTIACSSAFREVERGGRGVSDCSDESRGSPPLNGMDRPLTVHKVRKGRRSVLNGSWDEGPAMELGTADNAISELIRRNTDQTALDDLDLTPKAIKPLPRIMSAGAFLKSEFHSAGRNQQCGHSSDSIPMSRLNDQGESISPPKIPERRLSKSKAFFFKALGKRQDHEPKPLRRISSTTSKNTLVRRLSRNANTSSRSGSYSYSSAYSESLVSESTEHQLETGGQDIADVSINSQISPHYDTNVRPPSQNPSPADEFVLCPRITITPEISSVDGGSCNLWVSVEISGGLQSAVGRDISGEHSETRSFPPQNKNDLRRYGHLHSMRIGLVTGRDSSLLEVVGNLHESKTVYARETHLILAKLRIARVTKATSHFRESSTSDELMADLESHLGGTVTPYLTVRLSYKHSGFPEYNRNPSDWESGVSSHTTKLQTEVSAFIKRNNFQSTWSPRASRDLNSPLAVNPLIRLIEAHLPPDKARDAIRRLADERTPIPMARRLGNNSEADIGSSEETVKVRAGSGLVARIDSAVSMSIIESRRRTTITDAFKSDQAEIDPARQIWAEMRRNSRGNHHHQRGSISEGHYSGSNAIDADKGEDEGACSPSRLSISLDGIEEERRMIRDMALRNKRSVGQDTLRSIAPSFGDKIGSLGTEVNLGRKGKSGTVGGLGLGLGGGRGWGWGGSWW